MKTVHYLLTTLLCAFVFTLTTNAQIKNELRNSQITSSEIQAHIEYLASDELKGRGTGTPEIQKAIEYLISEFKHYGLKPLFDGKFTQEFKFTAGVELSEHNSVTFSFNKKAIKLIVKEDFITAPFSGDGKISGELVFVGYGITAPKLEYDDYEGLDVKGKIVIALRYNPEFSLPISQFEEFSSFRFKAANAKEKGAKGIVFINGHYPEVEQDNLMKFVYDRASGVKDFPVVHIKRNFVDELFKAEGKDLKSIQKEMSDAKKPNSFSLKAKADITTEIKMVEKLGYNVAAWLPGSDPALKDEFIVIGAHYDHLGMGGDGSLYRGDVPEIHNGADDNASGTAGVLELAQMFSEKKNNSTRSIIFIALGAEELGLLGSGHFVNNSPVEVSKIVTMINMDMIGRLNADTSLIVYGTGTSTKFKEMLAAKNSYPFKLTFNPEGFGPSDHSSFYGKSIPVLFFFTGTHGDYHRPTDDADKINSLGQEAILKYVYSVISEIDNNSERPDYINVPRKEGGVTGGWKVYVGTIPDFAYSGEGLKITGVNEASPAKKAGLQSADIIVKFGKKKIANIYDFVYALREYVVGDVVDVIVIRDNKEVTLSLELGAR